tara:strand:- start:6896 stop:7906 length:1011 start_codon:yes stop_codon:yes gene_type:complete
MLKNKNLLVTGGTGSFGQELVKNLIKNFDLKKIIVFSRDEYKQDIMRSEFSDQERKKLRFLLGDVRDLERLKMAMRDVDIIIHAAALKQVPAAEYNPMEFVKTNIHGAENIVLSAIHCNVKKIIALSTDKAANPINLYGSTKLASDKIFIAANKITGVNKNKFSIVRYGNVIGSRGSVMPIFKEFIQKKKNYFPITDKRMTRFWFTLQDSVKFVLHSLKIMEGGEIFVPKIPSIKITDLAKAMNLNYKLKLIGIRPGEKLHEQMCPAESSLNTLEYRKFYVIYPPDVDVKKKLNTFKKIINETGKKVKTGYEYNSINNNNFLSVAQIKSLNKKLKI